MNVVLNRQHGFHRTLCAVLAALMAVAPTFPIDAQEVRAAQQADASWRLERALPDACLIVAARPRQVFTSPALEMFPTEVLQAAGISRFGIDPLQAEQVIASATPPTQGPPEYAVYAGFTQPVQLPQGPMVEHTVRDTLNGKSYLQSQEPILPSFINLDEHSLLAAPETALQRIAENANPSGLAQQVTEFSKDDDLFAMLDVAALQPLIQMGLAGAAQEIPGELEPILEIPGLIESIYLRVNVSRERVSELVVTAVNEPAADRLVAIFDQAKSYGFGQLRQNEELQQMSRSDDPVEQAMGRYQERMLNRWEEQLALAADGDRIVVFHNDGVESDPMMTVAAIGVLVALLLPAVQAAREAARRNASINNMKQLMLSLHNYHDVNGSFPAHASYDDQGNPLLSWRVHILPHLEQQNLYDRFHLDEPWDSPHNKALIPLMPEVFLDPSSRFDASDGRTHYLGVQGDDYLFDGTSEGVNIRAITDGMANTIALVQVNDERAAVWTAPDDWQHHAAKPLAGLAPGIHPGGFVTAFCDGHVEWLTESIDPAELLERFTIAGSDER